MAQINVDQMIAQIASTLRELQVSQKRMEERQTNVEQQQAAELQALRQQLQQQQEQQQQYDQQQPVAATAEELRPQGADGVPPRRSKPQLPELKRFDGEKRNYRAWKLEALAKLQLDGDVIGLNHSRFAYLFARLGPKVQNMVATFFEQGGSSGTSNPAEFVDYLDTIFLDPNLSSRAVDRLRTLRQGEKESFSTFLPRFEKELADSRLRDAGDAVAISYLEGALNSQMSTALITMPVEEQYSLYVQQLARIGSRFDSLAYRTGQQKSKGKGRGYYQPAPIADTSDAMDWTMALATRARLPERDDQMRRGLCFNCNEQGHIARECPQPRRQQQQQQQPRQQQPRQRQQQQQQ